MRPQIPRRMTAKQYLKELRRLDARINAKLSEKQGLYAGSLGSARVDTVRAPGRGDAVSRAVERIAAMEAEIDRRIDFYVDLKHTMIRQIQTLDNAVYAALLFKRYVEFKRLEVIAKETHYSYGYIRRVHGLALLEFQNRFSEEIEKYEKIRKR